MYSAIETVYLAVQPGLSAKRSLALVRFFAAQYRALVPSHVPADQIETVVRINTLNTLAACVLDDVVDQERDLAAFEPLHAHYSGALFSPRPHASSGSDARVETIHRLAYEVGRALRGLLTDYARYRGLLQHDLALGLHATRMQGLIGSDIGGVARLVAADYDAVHANAILLYFTHTVFLAAGGVDADIDLKPLRQYVRRAQAIYAKMYDLANFRAEVARGELCNIAITCGVHAVVVSGGPPAELDVAHRAARQVDEIRADRAGLDAFAARSPCELVADTHDRIVELFANHATHPDLDGTRPGAPGDTPIAPRVRSVAQPQRR